MNNLRIFENSEFGEIRTITKDNEPMFCLMDICKALDMKNPTMVASRLEDDEVTKFDLGSKRGETNFVTESGLYAVILRSDKPNANTNSSLESAKHIKQKKKSKKKHKERKGVQFLITAYCPCYDCSEGYGKITSTGKIPKQGRTIAVDPKVIPYGTKVKIKGLGTLIAEDCGGAIKGNRIDIYFESHADTERFGVQRRTVFILGKDE